MCTSVLEEHASSIFTYVRADAGGGGILVKRRLSTILDVISIGESLIVILTNVRTFRPALQSYVGTYVVFLLILHRTWLLYHIQSLYLPGYHMTFAVLGMEQ